MPLTDPFIGDSFEAFPGAPLYLDYPPVREVIPSCTMRLHSI